MDRKLYALGAAAVAITLVALATLWWTVMAERSDPRGPISFANPPGDGTGEFVARQEDR
jgi:hypothetical protein